MNTKDKGTISELAVALTLKRLGYTVAVPIGENSRYDLIADDGNNLYRVQCKTGRVKTGAVMFNVKSVRHNATGRVVDSYSSADVDVFTVYCPELDRTYWVPLEDIKGRTSAVSLRLETPRNNQKSLVNWVCKYELSKGMP